MNVEIRNEAEQFPYTFSLPHLIKKIIPILWDSLLPR